MTSLQTGDRIRMIGMPDDPDPIPPDTMGTVRSVKKHGAGRDAWMQVDVNWDNGRKLMLSMPPDCIEILSGKAEK